MHAIQRNDQKENLMSTTDALAAQRVEEARERLSDADDYRDWANRNDPDRLDNAESALDEAWAEMEAAKAALSAFDDEPARYDDPVDEVADDDAMER